MKRVLNLERSLITLAVIAAAGLLVLCAKNRTPNAPATPSGPTTGRIDSICAFTTIGANLGEAGVCYRFDWGNGDTSEWTDWVPSGQPGSARYTWRRAGVFAVRAQAKDIEDALSPWSNPHLTNIFAKRGAHKWQYQTDGWAVSSPAIGVDGTVYVGSGDKHLYAFEGDSPLANTPWPKFRHDNRNTGRVGGP